ncbi:MAG: hypothetical protein IPO92_12410 [Saprospiraceae bacterium]|nr:hypothetical protein [Saprospiraceae bacterium]
MFLYPISLKNFVILFLFIAGTTKIFGQPWMENTKDDSGQLNFFKAQSNFDTYWKDRTIEKGQGYKPFKRWEDYWINRVDKNGHFPAAGEMDIEWKKYERNHKSNQNRQPANWTSMGPTVTTGGYGGIGRINGIAFHPSNTNIIWAGSPGGGLWKSTDGGNTWSTMSDAFVNLGVSSIAIHPSTPDIMYIATGDGDASDTYSNGVLKSIDGGLSWTTTGLNWAGSYNKVIRKIMFDPDDNNALLIVSNDGIYRTINSGVNWTQEQSGNFYDIEANPSAGTNIFYASTQTQVWKSSNNGDTWSAVYTVTSSNRISLAVTQANSGVLYVLSSNSSNSGYNGLFKSIDSGVAFTTQSTTPVQTVHADKHTLEWQGGTLWSGNDGGVYKTADNGLTWVDKSNGLIISQMYRLGVSQTDSKVITGLQDNGTKLKNTSDVWSDVLGGDGMECLINPVNSNIMYGESQNGGLSRSTNGGSNWTGIRPQTGNGSWITPFVLDPTTPSIIYAAYQDLYKSTNQGTNWAIIGPTAAIGTSSKTILKVAPSNSNYIYVGTSSAISKTTDGGLTWTYINLPGSGISMLAIHPTDPNTIWITRQNRTAGAKVYKSFNGGITWSNISGTLPNLPANCIVHNNDLAESLYIGMDVGIYYINNNLSDWVLFKDGLPNVEVFELDINYLEDKIYAATYGRGLWKSDLFIPVSTCDAAFNLDAVVSYQSISFFWQAPPTIPSSGYQWAVTTSSTPPSSGTVTTNLNANVTGLTNNTTYYIHVRSNCNSGFSIWKTIKVKTPLSCGDTFVDSGGTNTNYLDNEDITTTICPNVSPGNNVSITFTAFNTESLYDAVYIYNGNSLLDPLFSSGNPATSSGFPAGGYYGTTIPGTFTSTHASGCLTFRFLSDGSVTRSGWNTNVSICITQCTNVVTNTNDSGFGSLRKACECAEDNTTILFSNNINGQYINLTSGQIDITKNLTLSPQPTQSIKIKAFTNGPVFSISDPASLSLENLELYSGTNTNNRCIFNGGNLTLKNVIIHDTNTAGGLGTTITNKGNITILENVSIKQD